MQPQLLPRQPSGVGYGTILRLPQRSFEDAAVAFEATPENAKPTAENRFTTTPKKYTRPHVWCSGN